jgi:hypothetical protein
MLCFAWRPLGGSQWRQSTMACSGCFVRMCWGGNQAAGMYSATSLVERVTAARFGRKGEASGAVWRWRNSVRQSCVRSHGTPNHDLRARPVSIESISTPTLNPERIRSRGSEVVASARRAPEPCGASQSSVDYVALGGPGDPRGRKSGAGPRAANPRYPARAEGEKRFRSATRNP